MNGQRKKQKRKPRKHSRVQKIKFANADRMGTAKSRRRVMKLTLHRVARVPSGTVMMTLYSHGYSVNCVITGSTMHAKGLVRWDRTLLYVSAVRISRCRFKRGRTYRL